MLILSSLDGKCVALKLTASYLACRVIRSGHERPTGSPTPFAGLSVDSNRAVSTFVTARYSFTVY